MDTYDVTILPGGRITIPATIRKELDLHPGDTLVYWRDGGEVYLRKANDDKSAPMPEDAAEPEAANKHLGDSK